MLHQMGGDNKAVPSVNIMEKNLAKLTKSKKEENKNSNFKIDKNIGSQS